MFKKNKISISIPAYNEEKLINKTLDTIPSFIDLIVVVDDKSKDKTIDKIKESQKKDKRIHLIASEKNQGLGDTILKAHSYAIKKNMDITVVMAGDNQMDPKYLPMLLNTLITNKLDYVKGNRFYHRQDLRNMPRFRVIGNIFTTFVTKFCTGYWSISDPLNGYTALNVNTLKKIDTTKIHSRYGFETSLLLELSLIDAKIKDVFIPARYGEEKSKVSALSDPLIILKVLYLGYLRRMFLKYTLYSFHPIALFYSVGYILILIGLIFGFDILINSLFLKNIATPATVMLFVVPFLLGVQLCLQAIVLDIQNEPK